jgi:PAS domain S-box-containing protein
VRKPSSVSNCAAAAPGEALPDLGDVLESVADGFIALDGHFRTTFMNAAAERAWGVPRESASGKTCWEAFPAAFGTAVEQALARAMTERVTLRGLVTRGNGEHWFEVDAHPLRDGGLALHCRDVTERQRAEVVLLERERQARAIAEQQARVKDEFLATLSHELRTPLSVIVSCIGFVRGQVSDPQVVLNGLDVIGRNARAELRLIEDILDLSDLVTGKMRVTFDRIDLAGVVAGAIRAVTPPARARGIRIHRVVEPRTAPVRGDAARLKQAIWNLLSNAVKFTPNGGRVSVVLTRTKSQFEVRVTDTGLGIDAAFLPHVFERFRQADASLTREEGGPGIGLALAKEITVLHGGTIRAASEGIGHGSTFVIALPAAIEERARNPARAGHSPR